LSAKKSLDFRLKLEHIFKAISDILAGVMNTAAARVALVNSFQPISLQLLEPIGVVALQRPIKS
jgi:hypothetical protein